jgi:hypothetical protein
MVVVVALLQSKLTHIMTAVSQVTLFLPTVGRESCFLTDVMFAVNSTSTKRIFGYIIVSTQVTLVLNVIYVTRPSAKVGILRHTGAHTRGRNHTNVMSVIKTSPRRATCKGITAFTQVTNDMNVKYAVKLSFRMVN